MLRNILLATNKDQKQNTYLFLLLPIALSIYTLKIGGKGVVGRGCSKGGGRKKLYASAVFKCFYNLVATSNAACVPSW